MGIWFKDKKPVEEWLWNLNFSAKIFFVLFIFLLLICGGYAVYDIFFKI